MARLTYVWGSDATPRKGTRCLPGAYGRDSLGPWRMLCSDVKLSLRRTRMQNGLFPRPPKHDMVKPRFSKLVAECLGNSEAEHGHFGAHWNRSVVQCGGRTGSSIVCCRSVGRGACPTKGLAARLFHVRSPSGSRAALLNDATDCTTGGLAETRDLLTDIQPPKPSRGGFSSLRPHPGGRWFLQLLSMPLSPCCPYHPAGVTWRCGQFAPCHAAFTREKRARPPEF